MYGVDIIYLAKSLRSEVVPVPIEASCVHAEILMDGVVDLLNLNDPIQETVLMDELTLTFQAVVPEINVGAIINDYVNDIRQKMREYCWDPRCKVKLVKQRLNKKFHKVFVVMDLETTAANLYQSAVDTTVPFYLEDVVDDNPSQELMEQAYESQNSKSISE